MTVEELYRSIGALDEKLIDDSERTVKTGRWVRWGSLAACAALALLIAAGGLGHLQKTRGENGGQLAGNEPDFGLPQAGMQTEQTQPAETETQQQEQQALSVIGHGPVRYSELQLAQDPADPEIVGEFAGVAATACIRAFEESMLADCAGMVEGVVTDIYIKTYTHQLAYDKFGEQGLMEVSRKSLVYELRVDKTWYGEDRTGQTIRIEDSLFFADMVFGLKEGHRYVIPFVETGDIAYRDPDYVSGELTRDSSYTTLYEFQPQIEVTGDGCYLVSKDWETLYDGVVCPVVMDREMDGNDLGNYYRDRMGLMTADAFAERMGLLLEKWLGDQ